MYIYTYIYMYVYMYKDIDIDKHVTQNLKPFIPPGN